MPRRVRITVLCEDKQHQTFVRRLLKELGVNLRTCEFAPLPAGEGSGEQFVREQYPRFVGAHRQRSYQHDIGITVMIDADARQVNDRKQELDDALEGDAQDVRQSTEAIAILVPRRNIETWIWDLRGESVDPVQTYPRLDQESNCRDAVVRLVEILKTDRGALASLCDSLQDGCEEFERIPTLP